VMSVDNSPVIAYDSTFLTGWFVIFKEGRVMNIMPTTFKACADQLKYQYGYPFRILKDNQHMNVTDDTDMVMALLSYQ